MTDMTPMHGKVCIVTGATSGIGLQPALRLAVMGAELVLVGRDPARGAATLALLKQHAPQARVDMHYADLARMDHVRALGKKLAALARIDVLINNAGAVFWRRQTTADGLERTFALNHLSYFLLTALLRPRLVASAPARIVNVASDAHRGATIEFHDLMGEQRYNGLTAYGRSKLCNILFTRESARRLDGTGVTANCLHPGFAASRIGDNNQNLIGLCFAIAKRLFAISPAGGAKTSGYLTTSPEVAGKSGGFYRN